MLREVAMSGQARVFDLGLRTGLDVIFEYHGTFGGRGRSWKTASEACRLTNDHTILSPVTIDPKYLR